MGNYKNQKSQNKLKMLVNYNVFMTPDSSGQKNLLFLQGLEEFEESDEKEIHRDTPKLMISQSIQKKTKLDDKKMDRVFIKNRSAFQITEKLNRLFLEEKLKSQCNFFEK